MFMVAGHVLSIGMKPLYRGAPGRENKNPDGVMGVWGIEGVSTGYR